MDSLADDNFYLDKVWIQCENSSCLKWRLLSRDDAAHVDPSAHWYCYMNADPWFNKCSDSEECFPEASQFRKHGLKYVYSKLPLGSLVLVKMHGWPRWPGILCPDPDTGQYVVYDSDGNAESHHVEFLGKPHSRGWAAISYIDQFPSSFKPDTCKRGKNWFESALEEGIKSLACSAQERLKMCYLSKKGSVKNKEGETGTILCSKTEKITFSSVSSNTLVVQRTGFSLQLLQVKAWTKTCNKKSSSRVGRKRKEKIMCSLETAESEDILSAENLGVISSNKGFNPTSLESCEKFVTGFSSIWIEMQSQENITGKGLMNICNFVSETEIILKDLDQILEHVAASSKPAFESFVDREDNNVKEEVANCCMEFTEKGPMEINTQEDCIIIDGKAFKAGECIESITDRFKEIDSLMAEFQDSL